MGEVGHLQLGSVDISDSTSNVKRSSSKEMNGSIIQDEKKKKTEFSVPFYKLFSFADKYDYLLMFVGTVGAVIHGSAMTVFFLFFGDLINGFGKNQRNPAKMVDEVSKVCAGLRLSIH